MVKTALATPLIVSLGLTASAAPGVHLVDGAAWPNASSPQLVYKGGPMLQHVKVFTIYWGNNVQFSGSGSQSLDAFYKAVTQSQYFDWLTEYNTTSPMQSIGRGSFLGTYAYTAGATGSIKDSDIQTTLGNLIDQSTIPTPDADTLYAVHFAPGIDIADSHGAKSCQIFCAYHYSFSHNGTNVYYSVIPDQGGHCAGGCGKDPSMFNNTTTVSSHELIEAVTDADVGQNHIAWYDQANGEIGDICHGQQGCSNGSSPCTASAVQKEWSNKRNMCIDVDSTIVVNDFSVAVTPTAISVPAGGMSTAMVALTKISGSSENVTLSATSSAKLTVSFAPATAMSDSGKSTVTFAAMSNATPGSTETVTVTAKSPSAMHTVDVMVTITAPADMAMPADMAQPANNGGAGGNGNGNNSGGGNSGASGGCSMGGTTAVSGMSTIAALLLFAFASRRRLA
jgi:hypothetical protein